MTVVAPGFQAAVPEVSLRVSRAGVTGVQKAVRIGRGHREKLFAATIDCTAILEPARKGVQVEHQAARDEIAQLAFNAEAHDATADPVVVPPAPLERDQR